MTRLKRFFYFQPQYGHQHEYHQHIQFPALNPRYDGPPPAARAVGCVLRRPGQAVRGPGIRCALVQPLDTEAEFETFLFN